MEPAGRPETASVQLSEPVRTAILEHARREAPNECCGLLVGTPEVVHSAHAARNELASPVRFRIDPEDHVGAVRRARAQGRDVIGAYHSHPSSPPIPSSTDLAEALPHFLYVIASLAPAGGQCPLRAWRLEGRNFVEVPLVTPAGEAGGTRCESNPRELS